jgi:hypothetical protein
VKLSARSSATKQKITLNNVSDIEVDAMLKGDDPNMNTPFALTDAQLAEVIEVSKTLRRFQRSDFLQAVADLLHDQSSVTAQYTSRASRPGSKSKR